MIPHLKHLRSAGSQTHRHGRGRVLVAIALAIALVPSAAFGEVLSSDRIDGRTRRDLGVPVAALPDVTMKAGALVSEDGRVLWARRVQDRRAIASITKIMTAVVALEHSNRSDLVRVPKASVTVGESTSYLRAGELLPMEEVLEALLVKSGNDAAVAIALHVSGSEGAFVDLMNRKAAELGLTRTHFSNPHGLDQAGHYSTAADLAVMVRYAMRKPEVENIVREKVAVIGNGGRAHRVESTNLLLGNYAGANGVKTGFTSDAGYCVAGSAKRDGIQLEAIVLDTANDLTRFREAKDLLDFGFAHFRWQQLASKGSVIGQAVVTDYLDLAVPAAVSRDSSVTVFDLAGPIDRNVKMAAVEAPVHRGDKIGVAVFTQAGQVIATVPLEAVNDVPRPSPLQRIGIALVRAWWRLTGSAQGNQ